MLAAQLFAGAMDFAGRFQAVADDALIVPLSFAGCGHDVLRWLAFDRQRLSPRELLARIRALLRRSRAHETVADGLSRIRAYRFAGWELNVRQRRLKSPQGETIPTTNSEFNLLVAFLAAPQRVLSREQLLELSRLHNDEVYDRSVDVQVGRLRKKIEAKGTRTPLIRTERGAGYVFTAVVETVR